MRKDDPGVGWLLRSKDPSVRYFALKDILKEDEGSPAVEAAKREIPRGGRLVALLTGARPDGGFGVNWYRKWTGAHWRLVSAVELGVSASNETALKAAGYALSGVVIAGAAPQRIQGLWRAHASEVGNAVGVCSRLGLADEAAVKSMASSLIEWQWPDGGWNCDRSKPARHSSFYESLATMWGLNEYTLATGDDSSGGAVERAAEFFLRHRLFRSCGTRGRTINTEWLKLHYPLYWHYDILQGLRALSLAGRLDDPRATEALNILESKRSDDGTWHAEGYYWRPADAYQSGSASGKAPPDSNVDVADWGRRGPNEMITLNALRVLVASGRL